QVNDMCRLLHELTAGTVHYSPPWNHRHAAHPVSECHTLLSAFEKLLRLCGSFFISPVVSDGSDQLLAIHFLSDESRQFIVDAKRLLNEKWNFAFHKLQFCISMSHRRDTNIHAVQLAIVQHIVQVSKRFRSSEF